MQNNPCDICGGCPFRNMEEKEYRQKKEEDFINTINQIKTVSELEMDESIFIKDGTRRRADMSFQYIKKKLILGFNEMKSHELVNIDKCPMLNDALNAFLPSLRHFLEDFCNVEISVKNKKKIEHMRITGGSVRLLEADNGLDVLLEIDQEPNVEHRMLVGEFVNNIPNLCRLSWSVKGKTTETVAEKISPELYIAGCSVNIPHGVFLQASKEAENIMIAKVMEYMGTLRGTIADLFCGLGTFTYPLASIKENKVISADSFEPSIKGLQKAVNKNQLSNVTVIKRNLFKEPFDESDLKSIKALVIDPPRAGAHEQCRELLRVKKENCPEKIVFVSCNPKTFVYDANILIEVGYKLERITLIDQFVYSKHQELIALFTLEKGEKYD